MPEVIIRNCSGSIIIQGEYQSRKDAVLAGRVNLSSADLRDTNLSSADLPDTNLSRADLRGADLSGAMINFQSHDLLAEILRDAASTDIERRKVAGLILVSRDLCWDDFIRIDSPLKSWALGELAKYVVEGDNSPEILCRLSKNELIDKPAIPSEPA